MLCETATTKFWRRSRKKSLVKFLRKCYSIHVADYLHVFVIVGELNNTRLQTNLLHFYFLGISRCPIAIASAIWYNPPKPIDNVFARLYNRQVLKRQLLRSLLFYLKAKVRLQHNLAHQLLLTIVHHYLYNY